MSKPEVDIEQGPESVVNFSTENMEIPADVEQFTGVRAQPGNAKTLTDDSGQVVAQAIPPDDPNPITIPVDPASAHIMSSGPADDAKTWLGVWILRRLAQAVLWGKRVIVKS